VKTEIVDASPAGIERAASLLDSGELVALPTETVYGLAADALDSNAVARIFAAKERPSFDPLILHLPGLDWLDRLTTASGDPLVQALAAAFWPGPLTLVLPRRPVIPDIVASGLPTVALRMSAHPVFRAVLDRHARPVAAPSANRFGRISPTTAAHVLEELDGRIPLILDGGPCAIGLESTVIAVHDGTLELLRAGPISTDAFAAHAPVFCTMAGAAIKAPGQLASHYAPRTPLQLLTHVAQADSWPAPPNTGLLAWSRSARPRQFSAMEILTPRNDPAEAAARLFAAMRRLDALGLDLIVAEPPPPSGLGAAILDRLKKASAPR